MTTVLTLEDRILFTREFNPGPIVERNCESYIFGHTDVPAFGNTTPVCLNDTTQDFRLVGMDMWMGIGYNTFSDLVLKVVRFSDGMLLGSYHQDKYDNSGDEGVLDKNFRPEGFTIAPNDRLVVYCLNCAVPVIGGESPMHPIILFYLSKLAP